jgi:hypothetical protein
MVVIKQNKAIYRIEWVGEYLQANNQAKWYRVKWELLFISRILTFNPKLTIKMIECVQLPPNQE